MDPASLAQDLPTGVPRTYGALAERAHVPRSTLHHRAHGRPSKEEKAQRQRYLTPEEEQAVVNFLLSMSNLGQPVRIKYIPSLALSIARQRSSLKNPTKPPGKNWGRAFEKRHPELKVRRVKALDWKCYENNIYDKITHWFKVIENVLQDRTVLPENVYNVGETGVMLSMLGTVKVLIGKDDLRDYRGTDVKWTMVTAIECISADGRSLQPLMIWPASMSQSNWTAHPTPGWHYAYPENGYNDSKISLDWLKRVFDAQTRSRADRKPRVLICDGFKVKERYLKTIESGSRRSLNSIDDLFQQELGDKDFVGLDTMKLEAFAKQARNIPILREGDPWWTRPLEGCIRVDATCGRTKVRRGQFTAVNGISPRKIWYALVLDVYKDLNGTLSVLLLRFYNPNDDEDRVYLSQCSGTRIKPEKRELIPSNDALITNTTFIRNEVFVVPWDSWSNDDGEMYFRWRQTLDVRTDSEFQLKFHPRYQHFRKKMREQSATAFRIT